MLRPPPALEIAMAYDEGLAERIREFTLGRREVAEKKMFGGIGFLLRGNMVCGVLREDLIVRVGPDAYDESLARPHTREFNLTGRSMTGWVMVAPDGYADDAELRRWVQCGLEFAGTLPSK